MKEKWRAEPGAYRAPPYTVTLNGSRWLARFNRAANFPEHLGSYATHVEAMEACAEHAEEMENEGWGGK